MDDANPYLRLVGRVARLEETSDAVARDLSKIAAHLDELGAGGEAKVERINRNWTIVFFAGALMFALYVTFVNTPMGLRMAEAGLPPTIEEPAAARGTPEFGVAEVQVRDGVGSARVTFSRVRSGRPVVLATPSSIGARRPMATSIVASSNAGFEVQLAAEGGLGEADSIQVHWVAY